MSLQTRICLLQRRFWSGDISARDALQRLLQAYVALVVRRVSRRPATGSPVALGIWRLLRQRNDLSRQRIESSAADEICRRLCDELLKPPTARQHRPETTDTIRGISRKQRRNK
jgi:hypothetical protein